MSALAMKRTVATALAGVTLVCAIGATAVSARPVELSIPGSTAGAGAASQSVPPPPSSIAAPAGRAYEELRSPDQVTTQPTGESQPVVDDVSTPGGFDLASAAIGAATGGGLVIMLLLAGGLVRRRPLTRRHGAVGA
jgi:hypothetical protein